MSYSLSQKVLDLISRAVVLTKNRSRPMRTVQTEHLSGEIREDVEHFEPYGFTSEPHVDAEALTVSLDGNRGHTVAVVIADRRYRLKGLQDGEVALFDDLGKMVFLKRNELLIDAKDAPVTITSSSKVTVKATEVIVDAPNATFTGNIKASGEISDGVGTMSSMRSTYNGHTHNGGATPDQQM